MSYITIKNTLGEKLNMLKNFILSLLYTNYRAVSLYRLSSWFYRKNMRTMAYVTKSINISLNGCDISPAAKIGKNITFCHTVGVVIGEGVVIGDNLRIYQNVTLGTKDGRNPEYPTVGDNVTLFAGCVIAGSVEVGSDSTVGANSVVLKSIPQNSMAIGIPAKIKQIS
ncbi:hypothetical protein CN446_14795 [Bacillus cereus]|nr:hypothetical protein CN446_14795 [Bacillus cereus]